MSEAIEHLCWLKMSFDGKRGLLFRARGDLRTVTDSNLLLLFKMQLRDYSALFESGVKLMPSTIYRWEDDC